MDVIKKMEIIEKIKQEGISDEQRKQIYSFSSHISQETRDEVCPALLKILLNTERGVLKNELGRVIFHLQKNDRLNTIIGLEKLIDASLMVAPEKLFNILQSSEDDAKELAKQIKSVL